jgi:hypothetical protein
MRQADAVVAAGAARGEHDPRRGTAMLFAGRGELTTAAVQLPR